MRRIALLLWLAGCGAAADDPTRTPDGGTIWNGTNTDTIAFNQCDAVCPDGTQQAEYSSLEILTTEAFYTLDGECQSVCEPIAPCVWPNVPVISANAYGCMPLEGFVDFPETSQVDFGWADVPAVAPWVIDTSLNLNPAAVAVGDVDNDGDDDVVVTVWNDFELFIGDGSGGFSGTTGTTQDPVHHAVMADMNGDGLADLITREQDSGLTMTIRWYASTGTSFGPATTLITLGTEGAGPVVADLDDDGAMDLVIQGNDLGNVQIGWGLGGAISWSLLAGSCGGWSCYGNLRVADIDGNGLLDVWTEDTWWTHSAARTLTEGPGPGWQPGAGFMDSTAQLADLNGDGRADLVEPGMGAMGAGSTLTVAYGTGNGQFSLTSTTPSPCAVPVQVAIGDADGDGLPEPVFGSATCSDELAIGLPDRFDVDGGGIDNFSLILSEDGGHPVFGDFVGDGTSQLLTVIP